MVDDLKSIHEHMLGLGLGALAHANWHANYDSGENGYWPELSVLQGAHAAEILIKARIAQEHPLLIFDHVPSSTQAGESALELRHLFQHGRTASYLDLPDRLWAATGIRVTNLERYRRFGELRNTIQHFAAPEGMDCSRETIEYIYSVIDPFIHGCWDLYAVDYNEDYDPHVYLVESLVRRGVSFLVSREAAESVNEARLEWPDGMADYRTEMERRFSAATRAEAATATVAEGAARHPGTSGERSD